MNTISDQLSTQYPKDNAGYRITITSLQDSQTGEVRPALLVFFAAVGFVVLIACANVANLLLARSTGRRKEFAIRTALGATRAALVRQFLSEAVVLAVVGGLIGVLLAIWLVDLFVALNPGNIPRINEVKIDLRVAAFALSLSISTGMIFGLAPALVSSRVNLVQHLKEGQRSSVIGPGRRLRSLLVISQVALALALMVGAGLLGRSFLHLITLRPGFNPEKLLTIQLFIPREKYKKGDAVSDFYDRVSEELRTIPGVQSVGATSAGPQFGGFEPVDYLVEGESAPTSGEYPRARYYNIGPDYFRTMQIPLLAGREFNERDTPSSPQVALINQTMARRSFPDDDVPGKRIMLVRENQALEIIGVVGDVKRFEVDAVVEPEIYYPYTQRVRGASYFVVRTDSDPASFIPTVRSRVLSLDSDVLVSNVATVDKLVSNALRAPRFNSALIGAFAVLALLLASFGLYAVISYSVSQRTHEIGVRMTVGADQSDILKLVVGNGMLLTLIGIALGLVLSLALTRLMMSLLFEVSVTDPLTFGGIAFLLTAVSLLACYVPARRATRIDPMTALRHE
jgi:putative ABC transport system permease protein